MEEHNENCPVCYDKMTDVDVCTTICKHKFHTGCILRCNNVCPLCRAKLVDNPSTKLIPAGTYTNPISLLDQSADAGKVDWDYLSTHPNVISELFQCPEQNDWRFLSRYANENAKYLLENFSKICERK